MNYTETSANCFHYSFFTSLSITPDYIPFLSLFPSSFLSFFHSLPPSFLYFLHLRTRLVASCRKTWTWYCEQKLALALSTCILTMLTNRHTINNWFFFHKIWTVLRYCLSIMNFIIVVCIDHNDKHSSALWEEKMRIIQICRTARKVCKVTELSQLAV